MKCVILSPYAHLPGHHWANAVQLANALHDSGNEVRLISSFNPINGIEPHSSIRCSVVMPKWAHIFSSAVKKTHTSNLNITIRQNIETAVCILKGIPYSLRGWHLHFIDARFLILLLSVIATRLSMTCLAGGGYAFSDSTNDSKRQTAKQKIVDKLFGLAFRTGKFALNCETDDVRNSWLYYLPDANIYTIPVAICLPITTTDKYISRLKLELPVDKPVFLIFGTHRSDKDYHTVIRAAKRLNGAIHLLFAGPLISDNDPALIAKSLGYTDLTVINDFIPESDVESCFSASDAIIVSYPADFDRGSIVLIQAAAYGKPVIASKSITFVQFFQKYCIGELFEINDENHLAEIMINLSHHDKLNSYIKEIERASKDHSWTNTSKIYLKYFESKKI